MGRVFALHMADPWPPMWFSEHHQVCTQKQENKINHVKSMTCPCLINTLKDGTLFYNLNICENIVRYSLLFTLQIDIISRNCIINNMMHFRTFSTCEI